MKSIQRAYYANSIPDFRAEDPKAILGQLVPQSEFAVETTQRDAWLAQIEELKPTLAEFNGSIYFEYAIPRMGKRVDVIMLIDAVIFVVEFKVGDEQYSPFNIDQVVDYALDLEVDPNLWTKKLGLRSERLTLCNFRPAKPLA